MRQPSKSETLFPEKTRSINVDTSARVCINCAWYEPYYRMNRGNVYAMVPTCKGYCLLNGQDRGPLRRVCKDCEMKRSNAR